MIMPISFRTSQDTIGDFEINNQVVGMPIQVQVYANFDRALPKIKCYLSSIKGPNFPLALYTNAYLLLCLPRYPIDLLGICWHYMASLFTGYFTKVVASKQEYKYNGKK